MFSPQNLRIVGPNVTCTAAPKTLGLFRVVTAALLVFCVTAYGKQTDAKSTSRPITGVTSKFEVVNPVLRSGEPIKIRVTLHNQSASPVEFRYVSGSFIEHIRIYDAGHRRIPVRVNAPFLESGADKVDLQPGEQSVNVVTTDLSQLYDLVAGAYELRFYYDLRLIPDETLAAKSMKRYRSKNWVSWNAKAYRLTVLDQQVNDSAKQNTLRHRNVSEGASTLFSSGDPDLRPPTRQTAALVTTAPTPHLGSSIAEFRSAWGTPSNEETLVRTARLVWRWTDKTNTLRARGIFEGEISFLDGIACEIVLRSKRPTDFYKTLRLAEPVLPSFRATDFSAPRSDVNGIRIYDLEDGTSVSVKDHNGHTVIVIRGQCYLRNEEIFDREAAMIRPPTSNH